jgi:hypothetical protein
MKTKLYLSLLALILFYGCKQPFPNEKVENNNEIEAIKITLENMALGFLKSWEPPYDPDAALALFTQEEDFHLVIGGGYLCDNYNEWTDAVPRSMSHEEDSYNSYKHEVRYIKTVVLSPMSGVVTIVYIWDSISKEGVHERTPGAITMTFRRERNEWKIVHYHGSHDEPEVVIE